jgi:hypothetical protein
MTMKYKSVLMGSGMLAVFFYVLHVVTGSLLWKAYNQLQQPISDLTASGAPDRELLIVFTSVYNALALIFALSFGILEGKKYNRFVFWGAVSFIMVNCISVLYGFFPEDLPGREQSFLGTMHIVITALIVPFTILSPLLIGLGFIKDKSWKRFGYFSFVTGILICIFGGATAIFFINKLPYFGLVERLNIAVLQLWIFCFSLRLCTQN